LALPDAGLHAVPLEGVKTGVDYVILITTPAGLVRYVLGDIVRFLSTQPPRLIHVGHTQLHLSALGEFVTENELGEVLAAHCRQNDWHLVNFHVAPVGLERTAGRERAAHEWWIELKPGSVRTPFGPAMAAGLDQGLQKLNAGYQASRRAGSLSAPIVRLVMPGTFAHWLRHHQRHPGFHRVPRARSDRQIADELGQISPFYQA
jgi:hypothetical protein